MCPQLAPWNACCGQEGVTPTWLREHGDNQRPRKKRGSCRSICAICAGLEVSPSTPTSTQADRFCLLPSALSFFLPLALDANIVLTTWEFGFCLR